MKRLRDEKSQLYFFCYDMLYGEKRAQSFYEKLTVETSVGEIVTFF
jgi:hypothetical protein